MFVNFFHELKAQNVPVSLREYLSLLEALDHDVIDNQVEDFYYLSKAALVKDERNLDKFDRVFGEVFKGLERSIYRNHVVTVIGFYHFSISFDVIYPFHLVEAKASVNQLKVHQVRTVRHRRKRPVLCSTCGTLVPIFRWCSWF